MKCKNLTAGLLAVLCLASVVSCGESTEPISSGESEKVQDTAAVITAETEEVTTSIYETLPVPENGFGGDAFTILCRTTDLDEMYSETETGDVVDDAVFQRQSVLEESLNIKLKVIDVTGDWSNRETFLKYVSSSIQSGDDAFQLVASDMNYMPPTILKDYYMDINELPYVDLSNPWWTKGFIDNVTINGHTYAAMGSLCTTMLKYAYCGYFNKTVMAQYDYDTDGLYQTVRDGKWTFDKMLSMAKSVSGDLNGDGSIDVEHDLFGICMHYMPIRALTNAFAIDYTTRDADGLPVLALYGDKLVAAYEKIGEACHSAYWYVDANNYTPFMENRDLFYFDVFGACAGLRNMESEFGVVPMPKYDEAQDAYRTETVDSVSVLFVPTTVRNTELTGMALECINYESRRLVVPAYFDKALQSKYARDEASAEMMEIIRDSIYYDFGYVFAEVIGGIGGIMQGTIDGTDITSFWTSKEKLYNKNFDRLLQYFREN